jgi:DNA-binding NtrC family response regulator
MVHKPLAKMTKAQDTGDASLSENSNSVLTQDLENKPCLLLVDDDPLIVESLGMVLQEHYDIFTAETRKQTNILLQSSGIVPSLALIDLGLPPKPHSPTEGFALIRDLLVLNRDIKILVLSGQDEKANIQHALTLGAVDFIPKPCDINLLNSRLKHQIMMLDAEQSQLDIERDKEILLGNSSAIETLRSMIQQFAETPFSVLIEGESGSGKELVAENLHKQSTRAKAPFLTLNCAAFSPELLEAQLFGHSKGAFTGATSDKTGFFEEANEGTLFLDEIGDLPLSLQSKLLRVLENGEYYRLGETQVRISNARIIAATNKDLKEAVKVNHFRKDLYHRLSVLTIIVPPLRDRSEDCFLLLEHFQKMYSISNKSFTLDDKAKEALQTYMFPGNVRELRNIVIRLSAKYPGKTVNFEKLESELETTVPINISGNQEIDERIQQELRSQAFQLDNSLQEREKLYINIALKICGNNLSKAARILGINRTTLYSRIQKHTDENTD